MIELEKEKTPERALLVGFQHPGMPPGEGRALLAELEKLAVSMGLAPADSLLVNLPQPQPRYYTGNGKAAEIAELADEVEADCIIFDDPLSPSQQRNWEKLTGLAVIDRQEVILEIFAARASTREAVLQVALARLEYSLPRLTRAWTHLSRQRGGTKGTRGEGETQLETDRRIVSAKIEKIKKELETVRRRRATMRKRRENRQIPLAGLVGYTNAGKSSLLKLLSGKEIPAEDKLFATLDPSTRRVLLPESREILVTDTVGFVRKLPHDLVEAFRATLEETSHSDFLIHVIDASSPEAPGQAATVLSVLEEIGITGKKIITVFNKIDLAGSEGLPRDLETRFPGGIPLSAVTGEGLENLLEALETAVRENRTGGAWLIPADRFDLAAYIHRTGRVIKEDYTPEGILIRAELPEGAAGPVKAYETDHI